MSRSVQITIEAKTEAFIESIKKAGFSISDLNRSILLHRIDMSYNHRSHLFKNMNL